MERIISNKKFSFLATFIVNKFHSKKAFSSLIQPNIQFHSLPGKYATALYSASLKNKKLITIEDELNQIESFILKNTTFKEYLENPTIEKKEKQNKISDIFKTLKFSPEITTFFQVLAENGRFSLLSSIFFCFKEMMKGYRNQIDVKVTSATQLDQEYRVQLEMLIRNKFFQNATLSDSSSLKSNISSIKFQINPNLIGGFIIEIGDKTLDMSLSSKVSQLNKELQS